MEKEQDQQVAVLNRSAMQLARQSLSIIKWAMTSQEIQLAKAHDSGIELSKFTKADDELLIKFIGEWKLMVGDHRKDKGLFIEFTMIMDNIKELYPTLTLPEVKLAAKLCLTDKLDFNPQLYNNQSFSVLYCTQVLNSFLRYKREHLIPVLQRREMEPPPAKEYDLKEDITLTRQIFEDEYNKFRETGIIYDPMNLCFRFLHRTKRLILFPDEIKAAQEYGATMAAQFLKREDGSIVEAIAKSRSKVSQGNDLNIQQIQNRYSRNYCVQEYFRKLANIEELTHTFKESEFGTQKELQYKNPPAKKPKK